jgi:hypothetical protein
MSSWLRVRYDEQTLQKLTAPSLARAVIGRKVDGE